jgi:hypothetical protein
MRHIENFQSFGNSLNEEFDILSKAKDFISKKIKSMSPRFLKGLESDLMNFAKLYNLSPEDLRNSKKIEMSLKAINEDILPDMQDGFPDSSNLSNYESSPEERMRNLRNNAKWVLNNPVLHRLSQFSFLTSLISAVLGFVEIFTSVANEKDITQGLVIRIVASIIVMMFTAVVGRIEYSPEEARRDLEDLGE